MEHKNAQECNVAFLCIFYNQEKKTGLQFVIFVVKYGGDRILSIY